MLCFMKMKVQKKVLLIFDRNSLRKSKNKEVFFDRDFSFFVLMKRLKKYLREDWRRELDEQLFFDRMIMKGDISF